MNTKKNSFADIELRTAQPHPTKKIFVTNGVKLQDVASSIVDYSPGYTRNVLNGHVRGSKRLNEMLWALARKVEGRNMATANHNS